MPEETMSVATFQDATLRAIRELTEAEGHYPAPIDVAAKLGISRQNLFERVKSLESAGLVERLNHGHALRVVSREARP